MKQVGHDTDIDCVTSYEHIREIIEVLDAIKAVPQGTERAVFIAENEINVTDLLEELFSESGRLLSLYRQRFQSSSDLDE